MPTGLDQLHEVQRADVRPTGAALARAFEHDPIWAKVFLGISIDKTAVWYEGPLLYGLKYGSVYATSNQLEGAFVALPDKYADMSMWRMIRAGSMKLGLRTHPKIMLRALPLMRDFKVLQEHREEHMSGRGYVYVMIVGVDPQYQGQGLGGRLLRALTEESDQTGVPLYLETETEDNRSMYQRLGFKLLRETRLPVLDVPMWEMMRDAHHSASVATR